MDIEWLISGGIFLVSFIVLCEASRIMKYYKDEILRYGPIRGPRGEIYRPWTPFKLQVYRWMSLLLVFVSIANYFFRPFESFLWAIVGVWTFYALYRSGDTFRWVNEIKKRERSIK